MESGDKAAEDQLKESIGQKQMLIVLDNCEHLIEELASTASSLLSACPRLKMLATSRESFRIASEWLYPIPAFDIPKESDTIDLEDALDFPALMLFVERARAVRPDFKLTVDNIQTIAAICAHLDGLPLVIELIAARMRLMSPQALLERLSG
jgi:predicted ATPase